MQKQIVREINNGSWKSTEDYENITNTTNIYKIMKSTTIENGINRALSTGDFSIKQSNSSKVGVAQVLNRLTYASGLSHSRRISTPIDKSGKLVPPRMLHNTSWGFLCPAETPEGQSVGVVKNLSYMTHMTISSNTDPILSYIKTKDFIDINFCYFILKIYLLEHYRNFLTVWSISGKKFYHFFPSLSLIVLEDVVNSNLYFSLGLALLKHCTEAKATS